MNGGDVGAGVIRNVLFFNTGRLFSLESIRHHTNVGKQPVTDENKDNGAVMVNILREKNMIIWFCTMTL